MLCMVPPILTLLGTAMDGAILEGIHTSDGGRPLGNKNTHEN